MKKLLNDRNTPLEIRIEKNENRSQNSQRKKLQTLTVRMSQKEI